MNPAVPLDPSTRHSLGVLLGMVRTEIVRALEAELAASDIDLRFTQFLMIKRLATLGPMSASELARAVEIDGGAMTRQLDQLEGKGLLLRRPHEQDRRTLRIELTATGQALFAELTTCNERVLAAAQRALSDEEQSQLHAYLGRVLATLRDKN